MLHKVTVVNTYEILNFDTNEQTDIFRSQWYVHAIVKISVKA
jgi:hypothetical protein